MADSLWKENQQLGRIAETIFSPHESAKLIGAKIWRIVLKT
jgi:hypothetical protein